MNEICERMLSLLSARNMSYSALAAATGISRSTLQRYATGTTDKIPFERLSAIAKALGVSPAYLADGEEESLQAQTQEERKILLLARKAAEIPASQREQLIRHFEDTIDIYLNARDVPKED